MKEAGEKTIDQSKKLSDAIRDVKNAFADRDDVVVDMREAHRMRLDLLAAELAPVFADVPADMDNFDFVVSSGLQPRLWIDAISHVAMGRDRRTYRFLKDTRIGRVVLAESTEMKPVADSVTRYVAERIVERQRMLEGGVEPAVAGLKRAYVPEAEPPLRATERGKRWSALLSGLGLVAAGALVGLVVSVVLFWDRIVAMVVNLRP
ncbi:hypothetical protein EN904_16180 [Mesorhizobium sp. M7A.F.Ca.CA.001.07.2.1]|uniref:hypothetical protein n=1 Tax=Mesorhizobium TaxID=68287 RepID=UPI000FCC5260|nr:MULTISPECIES: hypothetical protein [Mesorhizobium]MCF6123192.1 hypothetical protein [Mesorhizobium ciceri]MCQ8817055.1 hypothetical protein [Mesorhizobium sp. SEMIA396]RUU93392.1 hypothetical protein EOB59_03580 [Mesorhizobium sp. M7A.F.Ca.MR.176.00.0.0]RUV36053.1 hypothetical protein EOB49_18350 [Mesorhizobium sp. M7A.F.Ca.MR.148.00.0.0]RUX85897.1 hypothetical protein EN982_17135 [Mesorhizobium sp. M7A.F.Ca.CA.004.08.1.1]